MLLWQGCLSFLYSQSSLLLSWGGIPVPTEKELASSSCGAVPWGQPGLTPPAWPPPTLLHVALYFLPQHHLDAAAHLAQGGKERVAEGADAERIDVADALDLDQVALNAWHHCPDVAEGDAGK